MKQMRELRELSLIKFVIIGEIRVKVFCDSVFIYGRKKDAEQG